MHSEPMVLAVPHMRGRFYALSFRDAYNTAFASIGSRTTGSEARALAILGPARRGEQLRPPLCPLSSPTPIARVSGCIKAAGGPDEATLADFRIARLSRWSGMTSGSSATPPDLDAELNGDACDAVERLDAATFFTEAQARIRENPPEPEDRGRWDALVSLLGADRRRRDLDAALERGARRGREGIRAAAARPAGHEVGRWRISYESGRYGTDYVRRAAAMRPAPDSESAFDQLPAIAATDDAGNPLTGRERYVLRFPADATPPANAFWSLTTSAGSIGDLRGLKLDPDGSLPIHIQHSAPDGARRSNWLPAPADGFDVVLRLYWPDEDVLARRWSPPAVTRVRPAGAL
jgi:hypothetical protein